MFRKALVFLACLAVVARAQTVEVQLSAAAGLKFDPPRFAVAPGATVKVRLHNPDQMIHNLVITAPGARNEVVMAALALGADGPAKGYIPETPRILWHTKALNPGESDELEFQAPAEEGIYPYVCTFAGHGFVMFGAMYVTTKELPPLATDPNIPQAEVVLTDASDHSHHALEKPVVNRTFLPDCGPAAIAVGLPGGQSYCFDAGLCRLRYAWRGGFIDNAEHWRGKGEKQGKVVGDIYYRAPAWSPWRLGTVEHEPAMRWRGYQWVKEAPQFNYTLDGLLVRETPRAVSSGSGIEWTYEIATTDQKVFYVTDLEAGAAFTSSAGSWKDGVLTLTPAEARRFTLTMKERVAK